VFEVAGENNLPVPAPVGSALGGTNVNGVADFDNDGTEGDDTENFEISDNIGTEINYNAKVLVRVWDTGDYDGGNVQYHDDISDYPFTMADHLLTNDYLSGWHLVGPPLTPWNNDLKENFGESLGEWGSNWVAFDVTGTYDGLDLNLGEGYYLALATPRTLQQKGNPIIADPDCSNCGPDVGTDGIPGTNDADGTEGDGIGDGEDFSAADLTLYRGWNLIANPLLNKVSKFEFTITDDSGLAIRFHPLYKVKSAALKSSPSPIPSPSVPSASLVPGMPSVPTSGPQLLQSGSAIIGLPFCWSVLGVARAR
jgi:hypothetical protein